MNPSDEFHTLEPPEDEQENEPQETEESVTFARRFSGAVMENKFYQLVRREPARRATIFFIQVVLIATVLHAGFFLYQSLPETNRMFDNVKEQLPRITWNRGEFTVEADLPYRIQVVEDLTVILDPESELNRSRLEPEVAAVVTNDGFYYRFTGETFQFQPNQQGEQEEWVLTSKGMEAYRNTILFLFVLTTVLASGLLQTITQGFRLLLITAGGWLLTQSDDDSPTTGELFKIGAHLLAPLFLLDWAIRLVGLPFAAPIAAYEIALLCLGSYWIFRICLDGTGETEQPTNI